MEINVDMDGVLVDLDSVWYTRYNEDYNDNLTPDKVIKWDIQKFVKPECGKKIFDYLKEPNFFNNLPPYPGAVEGIIRLHNMGHIITIASASILESYEGKGKWLAAYIPFLTKQDVVFLHSKGKLQGDILADDGPHNIIDFIAKTRPGDLRVPVVIDKTYNRPPEVPSGLIRVSSIAQLAAIAEKARDLSLEAFKAAYLNFIVSQ